jgi:hypothetical protein
MDAISWPRAVAVGALVLVAALTIGATRAPRAVTAQEAGGFPAQLHRGTCDALGEVAFPLSAVGAATNLAGTAVPESEQVGPESAVAVVTSATTIEAAVSDLVEGGHALAVYESEAAMDAPIACGDVGGRQTMQMAGMLMPGDELAFGLNEQDGSGLSGIAILRAEGGSEASVTIYLAEGLADDVS